MIVHYIYFTLYYRYLKQLTIRWFGIAFILGLLFGIWGFFVLSTGGLSEATPPWIISVHWYEPFLTLVAFSTGRTVSLNQISTYIVPVAFLIFLLIPLKPVISGKSMLTLDSKAARSVFEIRLLYLWLVIPVFLTFVVSLDWPINPKISIYTDRYLIIVLPALLILVALGIVKLSEFLNKTSVTTVIVILVALFTIPSLINLYYEPLFGREDWRSVANELQKNIMPSDVVWSRLDHQEPLSYYLNEDNLHADWFLIPLIEMDDPQYEDEMEQLLTDGAPGARRIWFITQFYNNDLHGFPATRNEEVEQAELLDPQLAWLEDNFQLDGTWQFPGIQLDLFDLTTPK
ncbi:MAG: hypothetical protein WAM60_26620 [Candidatus Promineifilaceae bacterium]